MTKLFTDFSLLICKVFNVKNKKLCMSLSWIAINQWTTVLVFFHLLSCKFSWMFLFTLPQITLLIFPISFLAGLISVTVDYFGKKFLWSFSDMKQLFSLFVCILFKTLLLCKFCFQVALIFFLSFLLAF